MANFTLEQVKDFLSTEVGALDFLGEVLNPDTVVEFTVEDIKDVVSSLSWAKIHLYIEKVSEDSSITPTVMSAYQDIQSSFYQIAAIIEHDIANANKLTSFDKKDLEFCVVVSAGSSDQSTDIAGVIERIAKKAVSKMTHKQILILTIAMASLYAGYNGFALYLDNEKSIRLAETSSQERLETLRAMNFQSAVLASHSENIARAINSIPKGKEIEERARVANSSLVKAASETNGGVQVKGHNLSQDEAKILIRNRRRSTTEIQMTKEVRITGVYLDGSMTVRYEDPDDFSAYDIKCLDGQRIDSYKKALTDAMLNGELISIRILAKDKEGHIIPEEFLSVDTVSPATGGG